MKEFEGLKNIAQAYTPKTFAIALAVLIRKGTDFVTPECVEGVKGLPVSEERSKDDRDQTADCALKIAEYFKNGGTKELRNFILGGEKIG